MIFNYIMNKVYLQIGSNIEDRILNIKKAIEEIKNNIGNIMLESKLYESSAWGVKDQADFLNKVICIETDLNPEAILYSTQEIERLIGRKKREKWVEREIDIDILFYNNQEIKKRNLSIPHPLIQDRLFVLYPLNEIAKDFIHPSYNKNISELLKNCNDKESVKEYNK